jgi:hypothetical protein
MSDLSSDPRWLRLTDPDFSVAGFRGGIFQLDADRPDIWTGGEPVSGTDDFDPDNFLSADYCILDNRHFYLRGVSEIQIQASGGKLLYIGCWAEVSQTTFNAYVVAQEPGAAQPPPMVGSFATTIPGFPPTLGMACTLRARDAFRPLITLSGNAHPVARLQLTGVTLEGLLDVYRGAGIDLRAALALVH